MKVWRHSIFTKGFSILWLLFWVVERHRSLLVWKGLSDRTPKVSQLLDDLLAFDEAYDLELESRGQPLWVFTFVHTKCYIGYLHFIHNFTFSFLYFRGCIEAYRRLIISCTYRAKANIVEALIVCLNIRHVIATANSFPFLSVGLLNFTSHEREWTTQERLPITVFRCKKIYTSRWISNLFEQPEVHFGPEYSPIRNSPGSVMLCNLDSCRRSWMYCATCSLSRLFIFDDRLFHLFFSLRWSILLHSPHWPLNASPNVPGDECGFPFLMLWKYIFTHRGHPPRQV